MTVKDAAKIMGTSEQFVRASINQGRLDIGASAKLGHSGRHTYVIVKTKFAKFMGITLEELERRVTRLHYEPRQDEGVPTWVHSRNSICSID